MSFHRILLPLSALLGATVMAPAVQAAPGDRFQTNGNAEAIVVSPTQIAPLQDLRFGAMMMPLAAGTVTVDPDGSVASTIDISTFPGNRGPAHFLVRGEARRFFLTNLPNSATISNGTSTMTVNSFTGNFTNGRMGRFDNQGDFDLYIGATLNVDANQEPGDYSGTFTLSIIYQ